MTNVTTCDHRNISLYQLPLPILGMAKKFLSPNLQ